MAHPIPTHSEASRDLIAALTKRLRCSTDGRGRLRAVCPTHPRSGRAIVLRLRGGETHGLVSTLCGCTADELARATGIT